jgi:hypothetical protein
MKLNYLGLERIFVFFVTVFRRMSGFPLKSERLTPSRARLGAFPEKGCDELYG